MADDFWVIDVLHDLGKYAEDKGLRRLNKAMEMASDVFLDDKRDQLLKGMAYLDREGPKPLNGETVVQFPEVVKR